MAGLLWVVNAQAEAAAVRRLGDGGRVTIGRGANADVVLADEYASRIHCAVEGKDGEFYVVDMGSGNGTRVNGRRVSRSRLRSGDEIAAGRTRLIFAREATRPPDGAADSAGGLLEAIEQTLAGDRALAVGDYWVLERLAKGGMGSVFRAFHQPAYRIVALKVLSPKLLADGTVLKRFEQEARSAAQLHHPNVVTVYDMGQERGLRYIAMEFVDGESLRRVVRRKKRIAEKDAVRVGLGVAAALEHASAMGIVHRDVKPGNVMITPYGDIKLCDFGVAKAMQASAPQLTATGFTVGTPAYMSPEQIEVSGLDHRSDIYSLGATLFHAATGQKPFQRDTSLDTMNAHVNEPLPPPKSINPELSDGFAAVIVRMMAKRPHDRYQTYAELCEDLQAVQQGLQPPHASAPQRPSKARHGRHGPAAGRAADDAETQPSPQGIVSRLIRPVAAFGARAGDMVKRAQSVVAPDEGDSPPQPNPMERIAMNTPARQRPAIRKLGTTDLDLVETNPVVFNGKVYRCEWVHKAYAGNKIGEDYFRFVDRASGKVTPRFAQGRKFACAFVEDNTAYVTGVPPGQQRVEMFVSNDLRTWQERIALDLPGFRIFNTSLCKADDRYVLMFEISEPKAQAGVPFTARFAASSDLKNWKLTRPECCYAKDRYTAPHCLRFLDGCFYDFYLEAYEGYETRVVRSRDLVQWEPSPLNPVLCASDDDKQIANPKLSAQQRRRIADAVNINNSDIDFCEFQGKLIINYSWGNQKGIEFLAEAVFDGTQEEFLRGWFPEW